MCKVKTLWEKWGLGNKKHIAAKIITKHERVFVYWNDVIVGGWSSWGDQMTVYMVEEETEDLVTKEVIFESFAFSYASSYIFFVNMTTSIMYSNSMILSASRKLNDSPPALWPLHSSVRIFFSLCITECSQLFEVLHK